MSVSVYLTVSGTTATDGASVAEVYNPVDELCCEGRRIANPDGLLDCCAGVLYNTTDQICCAHLGKGHLHDRYQGYGVEIGKGDAGE